MVAAAMVCQKSNQQPAPCETRIRERERLHLLSDLIGLLVTG
jgi:hypothetical protein